MGSNLRVLNPRGPALDFHWIENQRIYLQKELDQLLTLMPKIENVIEKLEDNLKMLKNTKSIVSLQEYKKIITEIIDKREKLLILQAQHAYHEKDFLAIKEITERPLGILIKGNFPKKRRNTRKAK